MSLEQDKLRAFESAILNQTTQEVEAIEQELQDLEISELQKAIDTEYEALFISMQQQVHEMKANYKKKITRAKLQGKQDLLLYRNQMVDSLFETARQQIRNFTTSSDYPNFLKDNLIAALEEMPGEPLTLTVCEADLSLAQTLLSSYPRITSVQSDKQNTLGGFCLQNDEAGLMLDCRLQTALEDQKPQFHATCGLAVQF